MNSSVIAKFAITEKNSIIQQLQILQQFKKSINRNSKTNRKHINNALKEELDNSTIAKFATVQKDGNRNITRNIEYYNLDMIISVGYR